MTAIHDDADTSDSAGGPYDAKATLPDVAAGVMGGAQIEFHPDAIKGWEVVSVADPDEAATASLLARIAAQDEQLATAQARVEELEGMLAEVYRQCGNHAPAQRRHALTPQIRDDIRDHFGERLPELLKQEYRA